MDVLNRFLEKVRRQANRLAADARAASLGVHVLSTSCCSSELSSAFGFRHVAQGPGLRIAPPADADILVVAGRCTAKAVPVMLETWRSMPRPCWVIAFGACAASGGAFRSYAVELGLDKVLPVDFYIPGCPPRPEALIDACRSIRDRIRKEAGPLPTETRQEASP